MTEAVSGQKDEDRVGRYILGRKEVKADGPYAEVALLWGDC